MNKKEGELFKNLFNYGLESSSNLLKDIYDKTVKFKIDNIIICNKTFNTENSLCLKQSSHYEEKYLHIYFSLFHDDFIRFVYSLETENNKIFKDKNELKKTYYEIINVLIGNLTESFFAFFNLDFKSEQTIALKKNVTVNLCGDRYIGVDVNLNINDNFFNGKMFFCINDFYWNQVKKILEDTEYE